MKNKLFHDLPKTVRISTGKWLYILPNKGGGYLLYDPINEKEMGRILMNDADQWIYDGEQLRVYEAEEVACTITGHEKEMEELLKSLKESDEAIMFFFSGRSKQGPAQRNVGIQASASGAVTGHIPL
ncbi:hypothetical protein [Mucilaginibacter polytrichastri]|uniref:Uncharacterized protein n=1 Tax=Mucilaginibacter polytrichastri TaxID=1302689 RepID=A0A1Q6A3Y1_9SPHI|nr:hypothetical protein [Mucilaginibacter polytrichastri]OKS88715.1 hypothetical protein RG47T_4193 [Mucilaginibacter polytrichastri]SFT04781.1 hypothetical protein SAMN04487890_10947 [Mucilaginibacter polytrichastri]